ncbi:MAG: hypothetical protein Q9187_001940 [Circinaria calcarea]
MQPAIGVSMVVEARNEANVDEEIVAGQADIDKLSEDLDQEDRDLQMAICASLDDEPLPSSLPSSSKTSGFITKSESLKREESAEQADDESPKSKRAKCSPFKEVNMETVMKNAEKLFATELPVLRVPDGDTYIYIDPPPRMPEQDGMTYQWIRDRYRTPLCMKKETLAKLNSPFLNKLFGPTSQYRVIRRRGLVNRLPPEIKYVLDLTPPNEGDEAMILVSELSCSEGIRNWVRATKRWNISKNLVGGYDDYVAQLQDPWSYSLGNQDATASTEDTLSPTTETADGSESKEGKAAASPSTPNLAKQTVTKKEEELPVHLEYTAVRHRSAIERVLLAVAGQDPKLDTAPKVWTTAAIAKYFEIKHESISDYVVRWLYAAPNTCFLEVMPEIALKMADGLKIPSLCQDAYALLVGEEALAAACQGHVISGFDQNHTVHGRKKSEVPDKYQTYIEYASKAFRSRITGEFEALVSGDWFERLDEYTKLLRYESRSVAYDSALGQLKDLLKAFVRGAIYYLLCSNYENMCGPFDDSSGADDLFPTIKFRQTWRLLHPQERILTRSFWGCLGMVRLQDSFSNLTVTSTTYQYTPSQSWNPEGQDLLNAKVFELIRASDVNRKATECYQLFTFRSSDPDFYPNTFSSPTTEAPSAKIVNDILETTHTVSSNADQESATDSQQDTLIAPDGITGAVTTPSGHSVEPRQYQHGVPMSLPIRSVVPSSANDSKNVVTDMNMPNQGQSPNSINQGIAANIFSSTLPFRDSKSKDNSSKDLEVDTSEKAGTEASNRRAEASVMKWELRDHQDEWVLGLTRYEAKSSYGIKDEAISPKDNISSQGQNNTEASQAKQDGWWYKTPEFLSQYSPPDYTPPPDVKVTGHAATYEFFSFQEFLKQAEKYIHAVSESILSNPHSSSQDPLDLRLTNTLVCLTDAEWKYLPLWAGGNDDDSGGVFDDEVPLAEMGFSTAGPKVHTGVGSSAASSEFETLGGSKTSGSYHTSTVVNDGYSDGLDRRRVYDADSMWGDVMADKNIKSDGTSFNQDTPMDTDDGSSWVGIMTPTSADEFDELERASDKGKGKMSFDDDDENLDENLDDIFTGEEENDSDFDDGEEVEMDDFEGEDEQGMDDGSNHVPNTKS